jgi:hypothetical protein
MTFPTTTASTANLDAGSDSPASARADLYLALQLLNQIIESADLADGVPLLDGSGKLQGTQIPSSVSPSTLTLAPTDAVVKIEDRLRLQIMTHAQILALADPTVGDMCLACTDLTGAAPKLVMYNGTVWKIVSTLSSATTLT